MRKIACRCPSRLRYLYVVRALSHVPRCNLLGAIASRFLRQSCSGCDQDRLRRFIYLSRNCEGTPPPFHRYDSPDARTGIGSISRMGTEARQDHVLSKLEAATISFVVPPLQPAILVAIFRAGHSTNTA